MSDANWIRGFTSRPVVDSILDRGAGGSLDGAGFGREIEEMERETADGSVEDLPHHSTVVERFDGIETALWRAWSRAESRGARAIRSRRYRRDVFRPRKASRHYCRWTNYRVQTIKVTALVAAESRGILDVRYTPGWQVARRDAGGLASLLSRRAVYNSEQAVKQGSQANTFAAVREGFYTNAP